MAFIGNTNTTQAFTPAIDYFSGNASTTAFTLSRPVASVAQVQVVVNNVAQNPSSAYSVSGNTITFTSAPSSGTNNIYVYYTSPITQVIAPGQNTVSPSSLSTTNALYWDTSGNVGIGTTSPRASKLDVLSATGTQNSSADSPGLVNITGPNGPNGSQPMFVLATNDAMAANIGPAITFQARYLTSSTAVATLGYIQCFKENATSGNLQGALVFNPRNSAGNFPEAMRIDSSGNLQFNSGYGSVATAYGCRAWVNFNGTTASPSTIRGSGNVTSVTKNSTGDYTVNFTSALVDTNYCAVASGSGIGSTITVAQTNTSAFAYSAPTTSACRVFFSNNTAAKDPDVCAVAVFR